MSADDPTARSEAGDFSGDGFDVQFRGAVAHLCLRRPGVRNALDVAMVTAMRTALERLADLRELRCVVLRGSGQDFCAGANLAEMQQHGVADWTRNLDSAQALAALFAQLDGMPQMVVAAVQGVALGGGAGLLACCDVVVASCCARVGFVEARLGLVPAIVAPYVMRRLGPAHARRLFVTAEVLDAEAARQAGLVDTVVQDSSIDALDAAVRHVVNMALRNGPDAIATIKALVRGTWMPAGAPGTQDTAAGGGPSVRVGAMAPVDVAARHGAHILAQVRGGAEAQEGVTAFLGRRRPLFWVPS